MRRTGIALFIAGSFLGLCFCQSAFAADNLFPGNLFPDDQSSAMKTDSNADQLTVGKKRLADPSGGRRTYDERIVRDDERMRKEMQRVAGWLQEFSLRNQNRFPGVYNESGDIERAAEVQLTELVGSNPYANSSGTVDNKELNGLAPGLAYYYNDDGTPVTNSPLANDEWTAELTADNAHRIQLAMDQSATDSEVDSFRKDPPSTLEAAPGTISACGNGQGYIYVWGAGIDGKPLKDHNGKPYFITMQTGNTVENQGQEAGY